MSFIIRKKLQKVKFSIILQVSPVCAFISCLQESLPPQLKKRSLRFMLLLKNILFFFSLWGISLFCRWNITRKWESLLLSSYAVKGGILLHLIIEKPTARWERPSKHANQNTQPCSAAAVGWEWKELTGRVQPQNEEGGCTEG